MPPPFQLRRGDRGPRQQTAVSCGAACLTVARMLVDARFAHWVSTGEGPVPEGLGARAGLATGSPTARFAAYEAAVHARTNALVAAGQPLGMPWPRALGTPPWGALRELEHGASRRGVDYAVVPLRLLSPARLVEAHRQLGQLVSDGAPALLYVGSASLPRHVVLVLPGAGDGVLDVYEPATGTVLPLSEEQVAEHAMAIGPWRVPWLSVQPTEERPQRLWRAEPTPA